MNFRTSRQRMAIALSLALLAPGALAAQAAWQLRVDGLACPFCAYGIEKKLSAIKGVDRVEVNIAAGTVTVTMTEGATLDEAAARKAVREAGFSLRGFGRIQSPSLGEPKK